MWRKNRVLSPKIIFKNLMAIIKITANIRMVLFMACSSL